MKVCLVSPGLLPVPPVQGGAVETLMQQLVEQNAALNPDALALTVLSPWSAKLKNQDFATADFQYFKQSPLSKFWQRQVKNFNKKRGKKGGGFDFYLNCVKRHLSHHDYDVVVVENRPDLLVALRPATKAKLVLRAHNDHLNATSENAEQSFGAADLIITVSDYIKSRILTIPGTEPDKVQVFHNCVDLDRFKPAAATEAETDALRARLKIKPDQTIIMFVGRLAPMKGALEMIQAFSQLNTDQVTLLIVGSAWFGQNNKSAYTAQLEQAVNASAGQVVFTGYVAHDDLPLYHALADVVTVPSAFPDPCPLTVLEGLAAGKPMVVSDAGGIPELVSDQSAIIVPRRQGKDEFVDGLRAAFQALCSSPERRSSMGQAARKQALRFDLKDLGPSFKKLIQF